MNTRKMFARGVAGMTRRDRFSRAETQRRGGGCNDGE